MTSRWGGARGTAPSVPGHRSYYQTGDNEISGLFRGANLRDCRGQPSFLKAITAAIFA